MSLYTRLMTMSLYRSPPPHRLPQHFSANPARQDCRKNAENVGKVQNFAEKCGILWKIAKILKKWLELLEFALLDIPWIETDLSLALEN